MGAVVLIAVAEEVSLPIPRKNCQHDLPHPLRCSAVLRGPGRPSVLLLPTALCSAPVAVPPPAAVVPLPVPSAVPGAHKESVPGAVPSLPARHGACPRESRGGDGGGGGQCGDQGQHGKTGHRRSGKNGQRVVVVLN